MNNQELQDVYNALTKARAETLNLDAHKLLQDQGLEFYASLVKVNQELAKLIHTVNKEIELNQKLAAIEF